METSVLDVLSIVWIKYVLDISIICAFMYVAREKNNSKV